MTSGLVHFGSRFSARATIDGPRQPQAKEFEKQDRPCYVVQDSQPSGNSIANIIDILVDSLRFTPTLTLSFNLHA